MPRGRRLTRLFDTEPKREKLRAQHHPYWESLGKGQQIGFHKSGSGEGTWRVRVFVPDGAGGGAYRYEVLGYAATRELISGTAYRGRDVLDYAAACNRAKQREAALRSDSGRKGSEEEDKDAPRFKSTPVGKYRVDDLIHDYVLKLRKEGRVTADEFAGTAAVWILPRMGAVRLLDLDAHKLDDWRDWAVTMAPVRGRAKGGRTIRPAGAMTPEAERKRKARVNRILRNIFAALRYVSTRLPGLRAGALDDWLEAKPFDGAEKARVRPLTSDEPSRLLAACEDDDFRDLVLAGLVTGGRYSEITALKVGDFARAETKPDAPEKWTITFRRIGKKNKIVERKVALSPEGAQMFLRRCTGRAETEPIFTKPDGSAWKRSDQSVRMRRAVKRARLSTYPTTPTFHSLRDTFATRLLEDGHPLSAVSKSLGHSNTTVTEQHYAVHSQDTLDAMTAALPTFGTLPAKVHQIRSAGGRRRKT